MKFYVERTVREEQVAKIGGNYHEGQRRSDGVDNGGVRRSLRHTTVSSEVRRAERIRVLSPVQHPARRRRLRLLESVICDLARSTTSHYFAADSAALSSDRAPFRMPTKP